MGRHRWTNRRTVEQCPIHLRIETFCRASALGVPLGQSIAGTLSWNPSGTWDAQATFRIEHHESAGLLIVISAQNLGISVGWGQEAHEVTVAQQVIRITSTRPRRGRRRFRFRCPCGLPVRRLYLPFGQTVFRCRRCWNLTYESAQRHNHRLYLLARNIVAIQTLLNAPSLKLQLRGVAALALYAKWLKRGRLEPINPMGILKENPTENDMQCRLVRRSRNILF